MPPWQTLARVQVENYQPARPDHLAHVTHIGNKSVGNADLDGINVYHQGSAASLSNKGNNA